MANTFKNAAVPVGTGDTDLYICSVDSAVIHALYIANLNETTAIKATIKFHDDSAASVITLAHKIDIPIGSTLIFDKPINLENLDKITVAVDQTSSAEAFASLVEAPE